MAFVNSEHEYVLDTLKDAHCEFEKYYQRFCAEKGVPINDLNSKNKEKLNKIFPKKEQEVDENGLVKCNNSNSDQEPMDKSLQKMYRAVATKIHPDKFSNIEQTSDVLEKIEMFKEVTSAYNDRKWGKFLDICEKLDILPKRYSKIMKIMRDEIAALNMKIDGHKKTFSWRLFECEEDESCKESIIKNFLSQLFGYQVKDNVIRI